MVLGTGQLIGGQRPTFLWLFRNIRPERSGKADFLKSKYEPRREDLCVKRIQFSCQSMVSVTGLSPQKLWLQAGRPDSARAVSGHSTTETLDGPNSDPAASCPLPAASALPATEGATESTHKAAGTCFLEALWAHNVCCLRVGAGGT